ncbi:hypothetical protein BOTBODRAFT_49592, partial [Botryobasidium botryosum FD-172 SS1]
MPVTRRSARNLPKDSDAEVEGAEQPDKEPLHIPAPQKAGIKKVLLKLPASEKAIPDPNALNDAKQKAPAKAKAPAKRKAPAKGKAKPKTKQEADVNEEEMTQDELQSLIHEEEKVRNNKVTQKTRARVAIDGAISDARVKHLQEVFMRRFGSSAEEHLFHDSGESVRPPSNGPSTSAQTHDNLPQPAPNSPPIAIVSVELSATAKLTKPTVPTVPSVAAAPLITATTAPLATGTITADSEPKETSVGASNDITSIGERVHAPIPGEKVYQLRPISTQGSDTHIKHVPTEASASSDGGDIDIEVDLDNL